ncbi:glycoside hydrolase family 99-like domain-containing protein [Granulosicoccaceae sp. 1_MG-2023]|nr:glycoside hydrolase family 99-like domain-containing protein [Granulosicoccaceae sp. 1_MG-2023]
MVLSVRSTSHQSRRATQELLRVLKPHGSVNVPSSSGLLAENLTQYNSQWDDAAAQSGPVADCVSVAGSLSRFLAVAVVKADAAEAVLQQVIDELARLVSRRVSNTRRAQGLARLAQQLKPLADMPEEALSEFNPKTYLALNHDLQQALGKAGDLQVFAHYLLHGYAEILSGSRPPLPSRVDADPAANDGQVHEVMLTPAEIENRIRESGLVDEVWYREQYKVEGDVVSHYCREGQKAGNHPCYYFDDEFYLAQNPDVANSGLMPLLHFVLHGQAELRRPSASFDPHWYRDEYKADLPLAHYLCEGRELGCSGNPLVDVDYYLSVHADVKAAGVDPVEHSMEMGWQEGRKPNADFDVAYYRATHLADQPDCNPLKDYLMRGMAAGLAVNAETDRGDGKALTGATVLGGVSANTKHFANPGEQFEDNDGAVAPGITARARTIAFYLPQFYAFEENDRWWGKGFTEWRNVMRGSPRFEGHYQPRIPRDLGFYDLTNEEVIVEQSRLAQEAGIEAFCFYYYWFNGKRLMDKPLDLFAESAQIDQPFCIMWANENWTRTWDGLDREVLIQQDYSEEDEDAFIADTLRYFRNERYIRVDGKPLFILYRPGLVPEAKATIARWRRKWAAALGVEPRILMVQGFGDTDPGEYGIDGAVEFPPHKVCTDLPAINNKLKVLDKDFTGHVVSYDDVIASSLGEDAPEFPLIKTVVPHWDNDARREGRGFTMFGSTPEKYKQWLSGAIDFAQANPLDGESLVFINAWNEWAEGTYLEPDVHFGHAYLNATRKAVYGLQESAGKKLLLVGHDAYRHGAQMLLLNMAAIYRNQFGMDVTIVLLSGGPLLPEYEALADVHVIERDGEQAVLDLIGEAQFSQAITNTSVSGRVVKAIRRRGIRVLSLIHELPKLITEYGLEESVSDIATASDVVVFPADFVERGFVSIAGDIKGRSVIRPQGSYQPISADPAAYAEVRQELGLPADAKIILNVGFADLRKGFDLFCHTASHFAATHPDYHFVWVGGLSQEMEHWVYSDFTAGQKAGNLHCVGFTDQVARYFNACDVFFLTSREDPYPTVVLEAMAVGKPVCLFSGTTGLASVVERFGAMVDRNDLAGIESALTMLTTQDSAQKAQARRDYVAEECRFDDYCFDLLQMLNPDLKKVSAVIPNYKYERYIASRIQSVFAQDYPVFETIVLDDCSPDNSVDEIRRTLDASGRLAQLHLNKTNSGNTFVQWAKGLSHCRGDYVWIAEADDLAEPQFLSASLAAFKDGTVLSFTDSAQIGTDNEALAGSYDYYYRNIDKALFGGDFDLSGEEFVARALSVRNPILNVSSVVWSRDALVEALDNTGTEVKSYRLVGDWRLYAQVLSGEGARVSYVAKPLNVHRRHASSVTHSMDHIAHLNEIAAMHSYFRQAFALPEDVAEDMQAYLAELEAQFGLSSAA